MQNSNFLDYSDVCLKINESIKVIYDFSILKEA